MAPAFTLYKFKKMFLLVVGIMFMLGVLSQIPPKTDIQLMTGKAIADEIDETGQLTQSFQKAEDISSLNPKSLSEEKMGIGFFQLMNENPKKFFFVALIITVILFSLGIKLKNLRKYGRNLFQPP